MTDLIHLCKVVFLNFAFPPAVKSHFNRCYYDAPYGDDKRLVDDDEGP